MNDLLSRSESRVDLEKNYHQDLHDHFGIENAIEISPEREVEKAMNATPAAMNEKSPRTIHGWKVSFSS